MGADSKLLQIDMESFFIKIAEFKVLNHVPDAVRVQNVGKFLDKLGIERTFPQIHSNEIPTYFCGLKVFESPYLEENTAHLIDRSGKIIKVFSF